MQVHLPLAVCLLQTGLGPELALAVHQVRPEDPASVGRFVDARGQRLLHHVVVFTPRTYAECQSAIRRTVASQAGARMVGCTRQIIGDVERIKAAMNRLALDRSDLDVQMRIQRPQPHRSPSRGAPCRRRNEANPGSSSSGSSGSSGSDDSDGDSRRSLSDFIASDSDTDHCSSLEDEDAGVGAAQALAAGRRRFAIHDDDED